MTKRKLKWNLGTSLGQMATRANHLDYQVEIVGDPFAPDVPQSTTDFMFALVASRGRWTFTATTAHPARMTRYLAAVERRSRGAAARYERKMRAHFRRYKRKFREGYTLPEPPTPQLRVVYDSAAKTENRPENPCGTTLHSGFSLGEYHWREWPLGNLVIMTKELI